MVDGPLGRPHAAASAAGLAPLRLGYGSGRRLAGRRRCRRRGSAGARRARGCARIHPVPRLPNPGCAVPDPARLDV